MQYLYFTFFEKSKKKPFVFFSVALKEKTKDSIRRLMQASGNATGT